MSKAEQNYWNKNFLMRYYPTGEGKSELITVTQFFELVGKDQLATRLLNRVDNNINDNKTELKLRRGVKFVFIYR